jgi:hypothetical protein
MPTAVALEVKRVPVSEDLLHPGDYVFVPKREPRRTFESVPLFPPTGTLRRLWWNWFCPKYELKQTVGLLDIAAQGGPKADKREPDMCRSPESGKVRC